MGFRPAQSAGRAGSAARCRGGCRRVAQWCLKQDAFAQVLHPAIKHSPGHAHWRELCAAGETADADVHSGGAAASLLSLRFDPAISDGQVERFCNALQLFKLGFSWAGPISLVVPYDLNKMRQHAPADLMQGGFVRLAIGLESSEDLIADLTQALAAID